MASEGVDAQKQGTKLGGDVDLNVPEVVEHVAPRQDGAAMESNVSPHSTARTFSQQWTDFILHVQRPIKNVLLKITGSAARNPKTHITAVCFLSIAVLVTGLFTNFNIDVDQDTLWTPRNSRSLSHANWLENESSFPAEPRICYMLVHSNGNNVLSREGVSRVFEAVDTFRSTFGYDDVCAKSQFKGSLDGNGKVTCTIVAVTKFWNGTASIFADEIQSDGEAVGVLSAPLYPDGTPVETQAVVGKAVRDGSGLLTFAESYVIRIDLPETDEAEDFETDAINRILELNEAWAAEAYTSFRLEIFADRSFSDEFTRAIVTDIPLVPIVFVIMSVFTCFVFFKRDWVFSRSLLGFGAVVSVLLSIMTGYGLVFIFGVPFTSMTQILPFIMFGIGLDDAFIVAGAIRRTDPTKDIVHRIHETIDEVGIAILSTTLTSVLAFASGCSSSIPAVYWLCLYAFPTVAFVLLYQITFFVALIVIDEGRVKDKRRDWLVCFTVKDRLGRIDEEPEPQVNIMDRFMVWYGGFILQAWVKLVVLIAFAGLLAGCAYSASQLEQAFEFTDVVPIGSYVTSFWDNFREYTEQSGVRPGVYFRFVDQSDPLIQQKMEDYVNELVALDEVSLQPKFFWLRDFKLFLNETDGILEKSFDAQIDAFLGVSVYQELYNNDIARDDNGLVLSTRTWLRFDNVDQEVIENQIEALKNQRFVGASQPINSNRKDWAFFSYDQIYFIWEFYSVVASELLVNTLIGIFVVALVAAFCIPHWTAVLFIFPLTCIMYTNLLGVLQFAGIKVNAVSYISLVMSIGLIVDFLMHPLQRYFESSAEGREGKIKDVLQTIGTSVLIGGLSTFLGVIPLAFSTSEVFNTIFVTFVGLVTLGLGHGLILLPVLLSFFGPTGNMGATAAESIPPTNAKYTKGNEEQGKGIEENIIEDSVR